MVANKEPKYALLMGGPFDGQTIMLPKYGSRRLNLLFKEDIKLCSRVVYYDATSDYQKSKLEDGDECLARVYKEVTPSRKA